MSPLFYLPHNLRSLAIEQFHSYLYIGLPLFLLKEI